MKKFLPLLLACLLCLMPLAALAQELLPWQQMELPPQAPVFTLLDGEYAVVLKDDSKVRESPDKSGKVRCLLHAGVAVEVLSYEGDYVKIRLHNSWHGYLPKSALRAATAEESPAYALDTSTAHLGYVYAAARGNGYISIFISDGVYRHQLVLPNDGQWHAMLLTLGAAEYDVALYESGIEDRPVRVLVHTKLGALAPPPEETLALMSGLHSEVLENPEIVAFAQAIAAQSEGPRQTLEKIRATLYQNAAYASSYARNIQYSKIPVPSVFLTSGNRGICSDYAAFMTIALRAAGIPAKHVNGINARTGNQHAWTEVLLDGQWVMVDVVADQTDKQKQFVPKAPDTNYKMTFYWDGFH